MSDSPTRLVQLTRSGQRRIAVVDGDRLRLIAGATSVYALAFAALAQRRRLVDQVAAGLSEESVEYEPIYRGESAWSLLPAFDHPDEPTRCLVTGTGLTHMASARNRQAMHAGPAAAPTDSMRMFQWGIAEGRPQPGTIGVTPEWFYKGCGSILRAHGEPLDIPEFAEDGGDEAEVACVYIVDPGGCPRRIGMVIANEFSDHVLESRNYLYLAHSKLRTCAIGPELVIGTGGFEEIVGEARIEREGQVVWSRPVLSGDRNMSHTLANLEHHHFKYPAHRRPGDAHVHFLGADAFSFGDGVSLEHGDEMIVEFPGFGRPLRNPVRILDAAPMLVQVEEV